MKDAKALIPPNSKESEMMVLGSMLTSINSLNIAADALNSFDFYHTEHQTIFDVLKTAYKNDKPADVHLVCEELKRQGKLNSVGGPAYVTSIAQYAGTSAFIEEYVEVVQNKAILRRMIHTAHEMEKTAFSEPGDVHALLDEAQQKLFAISQTAYSQGGILIRDILSGSKAESKTPYLKELQARQEEFQIKGPQEAGITGIPTHFLDLDKMINGLGSSNLIILAARPAMGKCVTGDTPIIDPTTGAVRTIEELVKSKSGNIATLGSDWKLHIQAPSHFVADGIKPTFQLKTALGKEIETTAVHPFLTIKGWKRLEELSVGDHIAVPRKLPYFGSKTLPSHELIALGYFIGDGGLTGSNPRFTNTNPQIVSDFKKAIYQFGCVRIREEKSSGKAPTYIVALDKSPLKKLKETFCQKVAALAQAQKKDIRLMLSKLELSSTNVYGWARATSMPSAAVGVVLEKEFPELPSLAFAVRENPVTKWLQDLCLFGKNAHEKTLPHSVFELTKENISLLINRLFSCDGTAYIAESQGQKFPVIAYASVSKTLIYQVQHLLLRFGILSKVRSKTTKAAGKTFDSFELEVHGKDNLTLFCEEIGIFAKEKAILQILKHVSSTTPGWTKDTIPKEIWDVLESKRGDRSWPSLFRSKNLPPPSNLHVRKCSPRRDTLEKLAYVLDDSELKYLAESDIYWDKIVSIESTGEKEVFDLTVEGTHNFIAADIIVHNTALALNIAENICFKSGLPVGVFSLEMSSDQLIHRLICSQAEVESDKLRTGNVSGAEFQRIVGAVNAMQKATMVIDDQPGLKITDLRARARRMKETHGIRFLVVDYLQLLSGSGMTKSSENRQNEIAEISRMLKNLARELNIPVLCLSQLSRKVEERTGHRPMMSDLRESGCLAGDTLIQCADTGSFFTIKELAERPEQKPFSVLGVDKDLKIGKHVMSKAFYSGKKVTYELKTRTGRSIKASANHPFLRLEGWTRLDQLKAGDKIGLPRKIDIESSSGKAPDEELSLLAHLLGDGCILPTQPYHYTSADEENIDTVQQASEKLFNIKTRIVKQKNWYHLYLKSPVRVTHGIYHPITSWFQELGIDRVRSYEKKIPNKVFQCNKEKIAFFLKHLWATDGNISSKRLKGRKESAAIYYASSSKLLCDQTQHLLLRLGIQSTLRTAPSSKGYRNMYHVHVEGCTNQEKFLTQVGSSGKRGNIVPLLLEQTRNINKNPNYDVIPKEAWHTAVRKAKEEAGFGWREVCAGLQTSYSGSSLFKSGISRNRMMSLHKVLPSKELLTLAESDVYWDEITSITKIGEEDVYDATVETVHNFVANDIIVHNSIEQDSDIVVFLLRREYYDQYDKPGQAEVIIAKNRHGGVGSVFLAFRKELAQFGNYSGSHEKGPPPTEDSFAAFSPK